MKLLKATVLSLSLLPASAYATGIFPLISPAKIKSEHKLCKGTQKASSNPVPHFSKMVKNIAWYTSRDNSMKDIDIKEDSVDGKVGRAMAIMIAKGSSQGIQVCPGVYLATAHGILDDPREAECSIPFNNNCKVRELNEPSKNFKGASHYPFSEKTAQFAWKNNNFTSPRTQIKTKWTKRNSDYVFIKTHKSYRPNDFIRPLNITNSNLVKLREKNYKTYLYRGETSFETDKNGKPNFKKKRKKEKNYLTTLKSRYSKPQKVVVPCTLETRREIGLTFHDCPTEGGVSGSPLITYIKGKPYLTGIHVLGRSEILQSFNNDYGSTFLNSNMFCRDYKKVCGRPCVTLDEALKE